MLAIALPYAGIFAKVFSDMIEEADLLAAVPWAAAARWFGDIVLHQVVPGAVNTLILSQIALCAMAILSLVLFPLICRWFAGSLGRPVGVEPSGDVRRATARAS